MQMPLVTNFLVKTHNPITYTQGPTNSLFKQLCYKHDIILQKSYIYNIKSAKILEYLQSNGFINKLEYFIVHTTNIKYLIFNINTNPIIKKIEIKNYNQLKVPSSFLIYIFKNQVGLPINYKKLSNSIEKIYKWYKDKGFAWIYIQLMTHKNSHVLCLQVFEGKIFKRNFLCKSILTYMKSCCLLKKIEKIIEVELGISEGHLLNIKKIERGIVHLKNVKLIKNCKYNITHSSKGFNIEIEYTVPTSKCRYFYYRDLIINFYKYYQNSLITDKNYYQTLKNNIINIVKSKVLSLKQLILYKYFGFKYYSSYFKGSYKSLITNIELTNRIYQLNGYFLYPSIKINKNLCSYIILNFYKKMNLKNLIHPLYNIQRGFPLSNSPTNFKNYLQSTGTSILCKYHIGKQIYLTKDIIYESNEYQKKFLSTKKQYILNLVKKLQPTSKIIYETITQTLIFFKIQIKHSSLDLKDQLKLGKLIVLESMFFIATQFPKVNILYQTKNLVWNFRIKYKQVFLLPNLLPYFIYKSFITVVSDISWPVNLNQNQEIFSCNYKYNTNMYIQLHKIQRVRQCLNIKYLNKIEYHVPIDNFSFLSQYIFYTCFNVCNNFLFINIHNIGLGIEFKAPIKTIPKIRFEYGIDTLRKKYYQFRILSLHQN